MLFILGAGAHGPRSAGPSRPAAPWLRRSVLAMCAWLLPSSPALSGAATEPVSSITLERSCFGCTTGGLLVLRRDGSCTYTVTGQSRHGTADRTVQGVLDTAAFDALARLALAQGFFEMRDDYSDPGMQDGAWVSIRIQRGAQTKTVFSREGAGPAALRRLEDAIEASRLRVAFSAEGR